MNRRTFTDEELDDEIVRHLEYRRHDGLSATWIYRWIHMTYYSGELGDKALSRHIGRRLAEMARNGFVWYDRRSHTWRVNG